MTDEVKMKVEEIRNRQQARRDALKSRVEKEKSEGHARRADTVAVFIDEDEVQDGPEVRN